MSDWTKISQVDKVAELLAGYRISLTAEQLAKAESCRFTTVHADTKALRSKAIAAMLLSMGIAVTSSVVVPVNSALDVVFVWGQ